MLPEQLEGAIAAGRAEDSPAGARSRTVEAMDRVDDDDIIVSVSANSDICLSPSVAPFFRPTS